MGWLPNDIAIFNGPHDDDCSLLHSEHTKPVLCRVRAIAPEHLASEDLQGHTVIVTTFEDHPSDTRTAYCRADELEIPPWFQTEFEFLVGRHAEQGAP